MFPLISSSFISVFCFQNYVAPEVIKGQYRPAPADMWSLGVVSYVLMSRTLPFDADSTEGIQRNILCKRFECRLSCTHVSRDLLVEVCLRTAARSY